MRHTRLLPAGLVLLTLWGCGGGSSGGGTPQTGDPLTGGRAALNKMASGEQATTQQSLQSALDLFLQAIQQNPNSSEAHFGAAVCLTGVVAQEVDGSTTVQPLSTSGKSATRSDTPPPPPGQSGGSSGGGIVPPGGSNTGDYPPAPPIQTTPVKPLPPNHDVGLVWNLTGGLSNPYFLLDMLSPITDVRFGLIPFYGYRNDDVARRQKMLTDLNTVVDNLAKVEADPNFTLNLPVSDPLAKPIVIGLPEVYLFDAYVNSLRVQLALSLAYVRETGGWNGEGSVGAGGSGGAVGGSTGGGNTSTKLTPVNQWDKNKDGKLTPDEYLPPSPYLTLRDPALLQVVKQGLQTVADKATKGIAGVLARPTDGGNFLVPNSKDLHAILTQARDTVLPLIQQAVTGPVTIAVPRPEPVPILALNDSATGGFQSSVQTEKVFDHTMLPDAPPPVPGATPKMDTVTINLAAWFAAPPADLKVFAPTYPIGESGWPRLDKPTYPDPLFGGLFPSGLPQNLLF